MVAGPKKVTHVPPTQGVLAEVKRLEKAIDAHLIKYEVGEYTSVDIAGNFPSFRVRVELAKRCAKAGWVWIEFHLTSPNRFWIGLA